MMTRFTDEQVNKAYSAAPAAVRNFIEDGRLATALLALKTSEKLSPEAATQVNDLALHTLIGLTSVQSLATELSEGALPAPVVPAVVKRLADLIEIAKKPAVYEYEIVTPGVVAREEAPQAGKGAPAVTPAKPIQIATAPTKPLPAEEKPVQKVPTQPAPAPKIPTPAPKQPPVHAPTQPPVPVQTQAPKPAAVPVTAPAPIPRPSITLRPGGPSAPIPMPKKEMSTPVPPPVKPVAPVVATPPPVTPAPKPASVPPPQKNYAADPYREPI